MSKVDASVKSSWDSPERQALAALVSEFTSAQIVPNLRGWEPPGKSPLAATPPPANWACWG